MEALITAIVRKENIGNKVSAITERLGEISLLSDKSAVEWFIDQEWRFITNNDIVGKFHIFEDGPEMNFGIARLHMLFENISRSQFEEIDSIVQELFADTEHAIVKIMTKESVEGSYLSRVLNPEFIDMFGLNLRNGSGIAVSNKRMKFEIVDGFHMNNSIYGKILSQLGEKSILELSKELEHTFESIFVLQEKRMQTKKAKVIPRLNESDLDWWNVVGTKECGTTCYSNKEGVEHYIAEASAGFKTLNFGLSNFFQDSFLDVFGNVTSINLEKEKGGKRYSLSVECFSNSNGMESTSARVTIRKNLGTERKYGIDVEPEVVRLSNVIYDFLIRDSNIQEIFVEYIRNNANKKCICGDRLEEILDQDIVEIGCYANEKHLMHRSCWTKWKKKNNPKKFSWCDSFCPFCDNDCSVYNILWTNKRLVWKNVGP